jgi:hypothetical protein
MACNCVLTPIKKFQHFYSVNDETRSQSPEMRSNHGKCGLVTQVGPQSRNNTATSISITSIKSSKAQQRINLGDHI